MGARDFSFLIFDWQVVGLRVVRYSSGLRSLRSFHRRLQEAVGLPLGRLNFLGFVEEFHLMAAKLGGYGGVVEENVEFKIQEERANIKIGGADHGKALIDGQRFGVQQSGLVEMDMDAIFEKLAAIKSAGQIDHGMIGL